jgi:hypothetical protein
MHPAAFSFVAHTVKALPPREVVLEYGGRDINGSVRELFDTDKYTSIDMVDGPGVDMVADAATYKPGPDGRPDTIVCCEVLEHTDKWRDIIKNASESLPAGGIFILTCATYPRAPHSAVDGGALQTEEYYENIDPSDLDEALKPLFSSYVVEENKGFADVYAVAVK